MIERPKLSDITNLHLFLRTCILNRIKIENPMKQLTFLILSCLLVFAACKTEPDDPVDPGNDPNSTEKFETVGVYEMDLGPTEIKVNGNYVYACRDDKVYILNISNPASPTLALAYDDEDEENTFEGMAFNGDYLYVACSALQGIYVLNISNPASPELVQKQLDDIYPGDPLRAISVFFENGNLWAGGSNGQSAMLVQYNSFPTGELAIDKYWLSNASGNGIEDIWANSSNVFVSMASGKIQALDKEDISAGAIGEFTYEHEPGHEHWGRTIKGQGNTLYWADWGAGFVSIDISDPTNMTGLSFITQSSYLAEHPDAEGTNVYDFVISGDKIYVANGWSGLLEIDINSPDKVANYIDLKDNMYRCIAISGNYLYLGDIAAGTTDQKGVKVIQIK